MEIIVYILLGLAGVMIVVALVKAGIFKKKKKNDNKNQDKKAESKPQEKSKAEQDTGFKISKKERLTKINKKALETDSRTATVERVYAKTPDKEQDDKPVIEINQRLSPADEDLVSAISQINTEERKVVSLGELKKQKQAMEQHEAEVKAAEEKLKAEGMPIKEGKRMSTGRAGEVTGLYSGISIGGKSNKKEETKSQTSEIPETDKKKTLEQEIDDDFFGNSPFSDMPFGGNPFNSPFGRSPFDDDFNPFNRNRTKPEPQHKKKFDIVDAVQAEAILNPKFKDKNKKK